MNKIDYCPLCKSKKITVIWKDKIRSGKNTWTEKKEIVYQCKKCELGFLKNRHKNLDDNKIFRKRFDGSNSVKKFLSFNKPRELNKLKKIEEIHQIKNKSVLESNCGAAVILDALKKKNKFTAGIDSVIYKKHVEKNHKFFLNFNQLINKQIKFDVVLILSEIEHKYDPLNFLKLIKKILNSKGVIILRIPNFKNFYNFFLDKKFLSYDLRYSHNFYFSEKNLDLLFKKLNLKIIKKVGMNEYSINHFIEYLRTGKRVTKKFKNIINKKNDKYIINNIQEKFLATSFLYVVSR